MQKKKQKNLMVFLKTKQKQKNLIMILNMIVRLIVIVSVIYHLRLTTTMI